MEKYYTEQGINKNLVWFQLMLQSLKTGQKKHSVSSGEIYMSK